MSNRTTLDQLEGADLAGLPLDQVEMLLEDVAELKAQTSRYSAILEAEMSRRFAEGAAIARKRLGKDTGTVRLATDGYDVVADLPKKVSWDQDELREIAKTIEAWGDLPEEYLEVKYDVAEKKYTAWPERLRKLFEPARTLSAGKATYKLVRNKEAA